MLSLTSPPVLFTYLALLITVPPALLFWTSPARSRVLNGLTTRWANTTRWLSRRYVPIIFLLAGLVLVWAATIGLWRVPFLVGDLLSQLSLHSADPDKSRSIVTALAAVLAAIAIFGTIIVQSIRVWTNERQITTIEQGHVTDRITKAVEQLGAEKTVKRLVTDAEGKTTTQETTEPNLEVRLGGIYALERIAQDSERDHPTIMEILCAYVRENSKVRKTRDGVLDFSSDQQGLSLHEWGQSEGHSVQSDLHSYLPLRPRIDIQAILTVIGRRRIDHEDTERIRGIWLNLKETNLQGVDLFSARLSWALFSGSLLNLASLNESEFGSADFSDCSLEETDMCWSEFWHADFQRSRMIGTNFMKSSLGVGDFTGSFITCVNFELADLKLSYWRGATVFATNAYFADLRGAKELTQHQVSQMIGNEFTLLPDTIAPDTGKPYYIFDRWQSEPDGWSYHVRNFAKIGRSEQELRSLFICPPGTEPTETGLRLPLDAPYPVGHPLANRS